MIKSRFNLRLRAERARLREQATINALGELLNVPAAEHERQAADEWATRVLQQGRQPLSDHLRLVLQTTNPAPLSTNDERVVHKLLRKPVLMTAVALVVAVALTFTWFLRRPTPTVAVVAAPALEPAQTQTPETAAGHVNPTHGEFVVLSGAVSVNGHHASIEQRLAEQDTITTERGAACFVLAAQHIELCLGEGSTVELLTLDGPHKKVAVTRGAAVARLAKQSANQAFSVLAGNTTATAVGTVFAVRVGPLDEAGVSVARRNLGRQPNTAESINTVMVLEGAVKVSARVDSAAQSKNVVTDREPKVESQTVVLLAGNRVSNLDGSLGEVTPISRQDTSKLWSVLGSDAWDSDERRSVVHFVVPSAWTESTRLFVDETGPWLPPVALVLPQGPHTWRVSGQSHPSIVEVVAGEEVRVDLTAVKLADDDNDRKRGNTTPPLSELLEAAHVALRNRDVDTAIVAYTKVLRAYPRSPQARSALVTIGQLELQRGQSKQALGRFETYLSQGGTLAPEALAGKVVALGKLSRAQEARKAMQQYVDQYPNHPHAGQYCKSLGSACRAKAER